MRYQILDEGFVARSEQFNGLLPITSRCALNRKGELLCCFMTQTKLASNDFVPHVSVSKDLGKTWTYQGMAFPHLKEGWSINVSLRAAPNGDLFLFGSRTPRTTPDESFWCQETLGILQNELIWSRSTDEGKTWSEPAAFKTPLPGAAESPAPMCVTRQGRWVAPYSPHNTFDPNLKVDLRHVVAVISDDEGKTWRHNSAIRVPEQDGYVAEAWITQLSDDRLLATAWHLRRGPGDDFPNAYALSHDNGDTWSPTGDTPIMGQSTGTAALPDGKVLFIYNQRRHGKPGVWLAVANPTGNDFGVIHNDIVWHAAMPTQNQTSGKSINWVDFAFGEPSATLLPDGTVFVAFWCIQPQGSGIGCVRVKID